MILELTFKPQKRYSQVNGSLPKTVFSKINVVLSEVGEEENHLASGNGYSNFGTSSKAIG